MGMFKNLVRKGTVAVKTKLEYNRREAKIRNEAYHKERIKVAKEEGKAKARKGGFIGAIKEYKKNQKRNQKNNPPMKFI